MVMKTLLLEIKNILVCSEIGPKSSKKGVNIHEQDVICYYGFI